MKPWLNRTDVEIMVLKSFWVADDVSLKSALSQADRCGVKSWVWPAINAGLVSELLLTLSHV